MPRLHRFIKSLQFFWFTIKKEMIFGVIETHKRLLGLLVFMTMLCFWVQQNYYVIWPVSFVKHFYLGVFELLWVIFWSYRASGRCAAIPAPLPCLLSWILWALCYLAPSSYFSCIEHCFPHVHPFWLYSVHLIVLLVVPLLFWTHDNL